MIRADCVVRDDRMRDLRCMSFLGKDNVFIIVAGCQDVMLKIDVEKGRVVEKVLRTSTFSGSA